MCCCRDSFCRNDDQCFVSLVFKTYKATDLKQIQGAEIMSVALFIVQRNILQIKSVDQHPVCVGVIIGAHMAYHYTSADMACH